MAALRLEMEMDKAEELLQQNERTLLSITTCQLFQELSKLDRPTWQTWHNSTLSAINCLSYASCAATRRTLAEWILLEEITPYSLSPYVTDLRTRFGTLGRDYCAGAGRVVMLRLKSRTETELWTELHQERLAFWINEANAVTVMQEMSGSHNVVFTLGAIAVTEDIFRTTASYCRFALSRLLELLPHEVEKERRQLIFLEKCAERVFKAAAVRLAPEFQAVLRRPEESDTAQLLLAHAAGGWCRALANTAQLYALSAIADALTKHNDDAAARRSALSARTECCLRQARKIDELLLRNAQP